MRHILSFQLFLKTTIVLMLSWNICSVDNFPHWDRSNPLYGFRNPPASNVERKFKRGMNMDVIVATKRPALDLEFMKELEKLLNHTGLVPGSTSIIPDSHCPDCITKKKDTEVSTEKKKEKAENMFSGGRELRPAYTCDQWDSKTRTCWVERNVGNTVTFVLQLPPTKKVKPPPDVQWKQVFHGLHTKQMKYYNIDPKHPPWNMVVGSGGLELRLSPVTEVDINFNFFVAIVRSRQQIPLTRREVNFKIRTMPIDQGLVYPGASLMLNMLSFVSLPEESLTFEWSMEREADSTLPSNMRLSLSGDVLSISELRKEQEGIVVCSVFTNLGIFATQRRFLIRGVDQDNNLLVFVATRPPYRMGAIPHRQKRQVESMDYNYEDPKELTKDNKPPIRTAVAGGLSENGIDESTDGKYMIGADNLSDNNMDSQQVDKRQMLSEDGEEVYPGIGNDRADTNEMPRQQVDDVEQFEAPPSNDVQYFPGKGDGGDIYRSNEIPPNINESFAEKPEPVYSDGKNAETQNSKSPLAQPDNLKDRIHDVDDILGIEVKVPDPREQVHTSDEISKLISECRRNAQCSIYAECIKQNSERTGFCRCLPRFEGCGIFCWEVYKIRT